MFEDRRFRLARVWSNRELARLAPLLAGDVVNVSAWDDRDKEGGKYRSYFTQATSYSTTNYSGQRGVQGNPHEHFLDLTGQLPSELAGKFDVVFNHTTLEHVFDVRTAFANLCQMSRDVVLVVVPFAQVQHECDSFRDFWRFTPSCLRFLYEENGLSMIYHSESGDRDAAIYLLSIGVRHPERWTGKLPASPGSYPAGKWLGRSLLAATAESLAGLVRGRASQQLKRAS